MLKCRVFFPIFLGAACCSTLGSRPAGDAAPQLVADSLSPDLSDLRQLSTKGNLKDFESLARKLEVTYRQRSPDDYVTLLSAICEILSGDSFGIANLSATRVVEDRFARTALDRLKEISIIQRVRLIGHLQLNFGKLDDDNDWTDQKRIETMLLVWQELVRKIDPKFDATKRKPMIISGLVTDMTPAQRLSYDKMLKENRDFTTYYTEQVELRELQRTQMERVVNFSATVFSTSGLTIAEVQTDLEMKGVENVMKVRILEEVKSLRGTK